MSAAEQALQVAWNGKCNSPETENTPQPLLTETLLRPLVRGQDEVVVEAELGAAVQPGTRTMVIIVCL